MTGILHVVATPIGNLSDITLRALEVLKAVDVIACEDTRHTGRLLSHYKISSKLISLHDHNEAQRIEQILNLLEDEKSIALVSDAGTPLINDPGWRIVQAVIQAGGKVETLPGPAAFLTALVLSGLPTDRFVFEGFLPPKSHGRRKRLEILNADSRTVIVYESPYRVVKTLTDIEAVCGNVAVCCARELTKKFEECVRGTAGEVLDHFKNKTPKGEFVILFNREFSYEKK